MRNTFFLGIAVGSAISAALLLLLGSGLWCRLLIFLSYLPVYRACSAQALSVLFSFAPVPGALLAGLRVAGRWRGVVAGIGTGLLGFLAVVLGLETGGITAYGGPAPASVFSAVFGLWYFVFPIVLVALICGGLAGYMRTSSTLDERLFRLVVLGGVLVVVMVGGIYYYFALFFASSAL